MTQPGIHTIIRDGRAGRDPSKVTEAGGEILQEYDAPTIIQAGDRLTLDNGDEVVALSVSPNFTIGTGGETTSYSQTVHVGN